MHVRPTVCACVHAQKEQSADGGAGAARLCGCLAIVESNAFFGPLFLYNNLHHIHHRSPTMPRYELPGHFRRDRAAVLAAYGNFYHRGYGEVACRYLLEPVFRPVHPQW
ncbi:MAG: fatty acid desaturase [Janthinobacterium lividum]